MTMSASGRSSRATSASRRRVAADFGSLAMTSVSPVTAEPAVVLDQAAAGRRELRSAEAGDREIRQQRAQLARQRAGVEIADGSPHDSRRRAVKRQDV